MSTEEERPSRRKYRRASMFAIITTGAVGVLSMVWAYTWGSWWNGLIGGWCLGMCAFMVWARHRTLNPLMPWCEFTVNGNTVAKFRAIEFPPGTEMQAGISMSQNPLDGMMALIGIEVVTTLSERDND